MTTNKNDSSRQELQQEAERVMHWLSKLSNHMADFEATPTRATKNSLMAILDEYAEEVKKGLNIPKTIPEPIRRARSLAAWYVLQIQESYAQCRISPDSGSMTSLDQFLDHYLDAIAKGRVPNINQTTYQNGAVAA